MPILRLHVPHHDGTHRRNQGRPAPLRPGHFDLDIIDEAHRSVYQKHRAIFDCFDFLLVGLTATPRDEIDRDTYSLFDLEKGIPIDAYDLARVVADKFLAPSRPVSLPLKFQREGIKYDSLCPWRRNLYPAESACSSFEPYLSW